MVSVCCLLVHFCHWPGFMVVLAAGLRVCDDPHSHVGQRVVFDGCRSDAEKLETGGCQPPPYSESVGSRGFFIEEGAPLKRKGGWK